MIRSSTYAVAVVLGATALLAGCGPALSAGSAAAPAIGAAGPGPSTVAAGGAAPDPCRLVTADEATAAVGRPAGPGIPGGTADTPQCVFGDGALIVDANTTGKDAYDSNHAAMTSGPAGSWQDVSGVGDGAFEVSGGPTALVYFYKGATLVEIILQGKLAAPADAAIVVARAAATRV